MDFFPSWVINAATIAIYVFGAFILLTLVLVGKAVHTKRYADALMMTSSSLFILMYALGNAFKVAAVGPEFFRFQLADIGFPPAVALGLFMFYSFLNRLFKRHNPPTGFIAENKYKMWLVGYALILSYAYEWFSGIIVSRLGDAPNAGMGAFDWFDIISYTVGAISFWLCLYGANRFLKKEVQANQEKRALLARYELTQKKLENKEIRARYKKPRKPGARR